MVLLCIGLLLAGTSVQAAHMHQDGAMHSDCALCVTVHVAVSVAVAVALQLLLEVVARRTIRREQISFQHVEIPFALSNRPPPRCR
jgi:hypothetical protein